eukprot:scaffold8247_cov116-Isochrysis_galbana.AAC.8
MGREQRARGKHNPDGRHRGSRAGLARRPRQTELSLAATPWPLGWHAHLLRGKKVEAAGQLNVVLVPKVEEDGAPGLPFPPLVKDKVALLERLVRRVTQRRRPVEVVNLLLEPVHAAVVRARATVGGAAFAPREGLPPGHHRRGCRRQQDGHYDQDGHGVRK